MMSKTATITMRVDSELKEGVYEIFRELGMTPTQALTTFLMQVKLHRGLPFDVKLPLSDNIPNAETLAAFDDAESEVVTDVKAWMNENA